MDESETLRGRGTVLGFDAGNEDLRRRSVDKYSLSNKTKDGEPCALKACAAGRGAESLTESRGVRRETPGSSTYLRAKAGGDKSMSEKRESQEGVYGAVPQDPRDMVKAILPEPQFPVVEPHTHRYHA